jgi:hypothetical protein
LISALQAKGANATRGATLPRQSHPYFSVNGQTISVNSSDVTVFEYMTAGAAENDAAQVAPTGSPIGQTQIAWVGPPQFYKTDRLIVLYVGTNGSVLAALAAVLGSPFAPTAGKMGQCGLGPITVSPNARDCATVAPQCPAQRPPDARTLLTFATCGFGSNEQSCTPVLNPVCPRDSQVVAMSLVNPNRRDQGPCGFAAVVHINGQATSDGGATILWDAQEVDDACQSIGPELEGSARVDGPCCERSFDIFLPRGKFTFRVVFRTDWQR